MSKMRLRSASARALAKVAASLGYEQATTETGHLRFTHRVTGNIVIAPSKSGGSLEKNAIAQLRRSAAAS